VEIANLLAPSTTLGGADYMGGQCHWQPHELCSLHKTSPADNFYHPLAGVTPDVVGLTKHRPEKLLLLALRVSGRLLSAFSTALAWGLADRERTY